MAVEILFWLLPFLWEVESKVSSWERGQGERGGSKSWILYVGEFARFVFGGSVTPALEAWATCDLTGGSLVLIFLTRLQAEESGLKAERLPAQIPPPAVLGTPSTVAAAVQKRLLDTKIAFGETLLTFSSLYCLYTKHQKSTKPENLHMKRRIRKMHIPWTFICKGTVLFKFIF